MSNITFSSVRFVSFVPAKKSGLHEVQRISCPRVSDLLQTGIIERRLKIDGG
jgi:hypothetical protein